ncbi:hypothetical protein [Collimonas humicola]|uniref:hypothetical protein n=1 Tax=Collimonas humicola TaxID=2825886 RepID=UPI001B8C9650|nr:hypothetical protein [Collimonas humicola]
MEQCKKEQFNTPPAATGQDQLYILLDKAASLLTEACLSEDGIDGDQAMKCVEAIRGKFAEIGKTTVESEFDKVIEMIRVAGGVPEGDEFSVSAVLKELAGRGQQSAPLCYVRATKDGEICWAEDCLSPDPDFPVCSDDVDGDGDPTVSLALYSALPPVIYTDAGALHALTSVRARLQEINEDGSGTITDTLWYSPTETLFDFIDAALAAPQQEAIATFICGEVEITSHGPKQYDYDIDLNLAVAEKINAANPGAKINLYAGAPPAAPVLSDDWIPASKEPEDHGGYIIVQPGGFTSYHAYFGHPYGERETGWYAGASGGPIVKPLYWRKFPSIPSAPLAMAES